MPAIDYGRLLILVVEDDDFTRELIVRMLRDIGVTRLLTKTNGKDGLMEVVRTRPDIVFCDIHMAPMNGRQFLQGVRTIKVRGVDMTPVVFLTSDADAETVKLAKELGVSGYLVKPVSKKQLKDRIDAIVLENADHFAFLMQ